MAKHDRQETPDYSLLDEYPETPGGHVEFLIWVFEKVHLAAKAKREQLERGTIERMISEIRWSEAWVRLEAFGGGSTEGLKPVANAFRRKLTFEQLEQIDDVLTEGVAWLRELWSTNIDLASKFVIVATVGDLWKAYANGRQPCFESSGISILPGANTPKVTCTDVAAEAKRVALDRAQALVSNIGGDKAATMKKLIAHVQLRANMDQADVINMPLEDFVAAATRDRLDPSLIQFDSQTTVEPSIPTKNASETPKLEKNKRSTSKGDAEKKQIAALTKHHRYSDGSCMNLTPINSNELARSAEVAQSTANGFFNKWFGSAKKATYGYKNYRIACADRVKLIAILRELNGELPRLGEYLFGDRVPDAVENPEHRGDRNRKLRASERPSDDER